MINPEFLFGNNTLYKKSVIETVGFFNENLKTNYEDVDISKKIRSANFTLIYDPDATVQHLKKSGFYKMLERFWLWNLNTTKRPNSLLSLKKQFGHNIAKMTYCLRKDLKNKNYRLVPLDLAVFPVLSILDFKEYVKK